MAARTHRRTQNSKMHAWRRRPHPRLGNERGIALIIALVMLVLLTILGAWALTTSSTDLRIAGNYRNTQTAFYTADAMVAYGTNPTTLTTAYSFGTAGWSPGHSITVQSGDTGEANVQFIRSGMLPAGTIYDADLDVNGNPKFHGLYFSVTAKGSSGNSGEVTIESAVVQVVGN